MKERSMKHFSTLTERNREAFWSSAVCSCLDCSGRLSAMQLLRRFVCLIFLLLLPGIVSAQESRPTPTQPTDAGSAKGTQPDGQDGTAGKSSPKPPLRVRVSQGVSQAMILRKVQPVYPEEARQGHVEGMVVMKAIISESGNVIELTLVSGHPSLVPAALEAVKQWKYKPYLLNNQPVQLETLVTVAFELNRR